MKHRPLIFIFILLSFLQNARSAGVSWSSLTLSDFVDSFGQPLDDTFRIQLGFFQSTLGDPFAPTEVNVAEWATRWRVFDEDTMPNYDAEGSDYFTSEAWVNSDGTSTGENATNSLGINFAGEEAYIWVWNNQTPSQTTEWFLARADEWILPAGSAECCDTTPNLEWSLSDLSGGEVTPIWGAQSGQIGDGEYSDAVVGNHDLQTFTFVPEPSSFLMALLGGALLLRRQRSDPAKPSILL